MEIDVGDVASPMVTGELKFSAPLQPGKYKIKLIVASLAVLGVEAEASTTIEVTPGGAFDDDDDDLDDY